MEKITPNNLEKGAFLILYKDAQKFDSGVAHEIKSADCFVFLSTRKQDFITLKYVQELGIWAIPHAGLFDEPCFSQNGDVFEIIEDKRRLPIIRQNK